jgi:hypothetical protein
LAWTGRANFSATKDTGADRLRAQLYPHETHPIIPWESNRKTPGTLDRRRYAHRNFIEQMMRLLKHVRRVAMRYDKTAESFISFVQLAAIHRWMRFVHTAQSIGASFHAVSIPKKGQRMEWAETRGISIWHTKP